MDITTLVLMMPDKDIDFDWRILIILAVGIIAGAIICGWDDGN